jgi:hypothetical protein
MSETVVFLGPSLDEKTARALFPRALIAPPAQCGDLLRILRLRPRAVVLIDGLFEQRPAVWHKEIALALERGVPVLGAASMGALRAAELLPLGMLGVGEIFEQFRDGLLIDDDEVAVVQSASGEALSDAMVNVRATIKRARELGVISQPASANVLAKAKAVFYAERKLTDLLARSEAPELVHFKAWVDEHGVIDIKRQDAIAALELARQFDDAGWPDPPRFHTPRTTYLNAAFRMANCSPQHSPIRGLPPNERVLLAARYLGGTYRQAKELALLRAALSDVAESRSLTSLDALEAALFASTRPDGPSAHVRWLLRLELGRYERYVRAHFRDPDPAAPVIPLLARAWRLVDLAFLEARLDVNSAMLKRWALGYRRRYELLSEESHLAFLSEYSLDSREWIEMTRLAALAHRAGHDLHLVDDA